jgi:integrase
VKGTINKRPRSGGRPKWEYCFDLGKDPATGKRRRVTKSGFETKRDAENAMADAIKKHRDQPESKEEKPMPTFAEFFARWHQEVVKRQVGEKEAECVEERGQYAIRLFGDKPLDQLSPAQLTADMNWLEDRGGKKTKQYPEGKPLSSTTVRHVEFATQGCLEQALDWEILSRNPMKKVKKHKRAKKGEPPVADRAGVGRLFKVTAGTKQFAAALVDAATGIRRGELCALTWPDIEYDRGTIHVSKSLSELKRPTKHLRLKSTKNGKSRRIEVDSSVLDVLRDHQREQEEHRALYGPDYRSDLNLVFCRPDGYYYSPDHLGTRIKAALCKAGLGNLSMHSLRHTHASQQLSDGVPVAVVSARLGHANPNITYGIYAHAMPADQKAAAILWGNAMKDAIDASRKEAIARKRRMTANDSADSEKIHVTPMKSAS